MPLPSETPAELWPGMRLGTRIGKRIYGWEHAIPDLKRLVKLVWYKPGTPTETHTGNFFELHCVAKGTHHYVVEGKTYNLNAGDLLAVKPGEAHRDLHPPTRCVIYLLAFQIHESQKSLFGFSGPDFELLIKQLQSPFFRNLRVSKSLLVQLETIFKVVHTQFPYRRAKACSLLIDFLVELTRTIRPADEPHLSQPVQYSLEFIKKNFHHPLSVQRLATLSGMTQRSLQYHFQNEVGMSPKEYILRCKIEAAKNMLMTTPKRICDIAYSLSFSSEKHFARIFKIYTCQSASDFRASHKGKPPSEL